MVTSKDACGEYESGARELRVIVLSMASLAMRSVELVVGTISSREVDDIAEVFDLHENIGELGERASALAKKLASEFLCDEFRFESLLSSLSIAQKLMQVSHRCIAMASTSKALANSTETDAARLLDPLCQQVCGMLRRASLAYSDLNTDTAESVAVSGPELDMALDAVIGQLRMRIPLRTGFAAVGMDLILMARALGESGTLAIEISRELLPDDWGKSVRSGGEGIPLEKAGIPS